MHYGTFFFTNIVTVTVFTVCIVLLAFYNRRIVGLRWLAGSLVIGLIKLILQGLEGKVTPILSSMTANELYLVSFAMQLVGLRWFVVRKQLRSPWPWVALASILACYTVMYLLRVPYTGNVVNIPFVVICAITAWVLFSNASGAFAAVARMASLIAAAQGIVAAYRAVLTNTSYARPWETVLAHEDPRWLYSLACSAFLAAFMVMCYIWFLVADLQRELADQAHTDPLTGAMNRRAMEEAALRETARSIRHGYLLTMIMLDIDNFKQLNDSRGHAAGDRALQALVILIKSMLRRQDMLARTGGEEFAILLPDTPATEGIIAAERIRQSVENLEVQFDVTPLKFTVSVGVAQLDPSGDWETMMRHADAAMYDAKQNGKNLVSASFPTPLLNAPTPPRDVTLLRSPSSQVN